MREAAAGGTKFRPLPRPQPYPVTPIEQKSTTHSSRKMLLDTWLRKAATRLA